ncbi:hypothetical protein [Micromonospora sp. NPDC005220]
MRSMVTTRRLAVTNAARPDVRTGPFTFVAGIGLIFVRARA